MIIVYFDVVEKNVVNYDFFFEINMLEDQEPCTNFNAGKQ